MFIMEWSNMNVFWIRAQCVGIEHRLWLSPRKMYEFSRIFSTRLENNQKYVVILMIRLKKDKKILYICFEVLLIH